MHAMGLKSCVPRQMLRQGSDVRCLWFPFRSAAKYFNKTHKFSLWFSFGGPDECGAIGVYKHTFLSYISTILAKTIP
jgi:hypothetical protein